MKIISFINEFLIIRQIFEHLGLWSHKPSRNPPNQGSSSEKNELVYEPFDDSWPEYEEPYIMYN